MLLIYGTFSDLFKNYWYLFVLGLIVIGVVLTIIFWFKNKKKFTKLFNNFKAEVEGFLNNDIEQKLFKLETIGQNNVAYLTLYQNYKNEYDQFSNGVEKEFKDKIKVCNDLLLDEKYYRLNKEIKEARNKLAPLKKQYNDFSYVLAEQLKDEDEVRNKEKELKGRLGILTSLIKSFGPHLDFIRREQLRIINSFEERFNIFNEYALRGDYLDAREVLNGINNDVENMEGYINNLQKYGDEVSINIPQKLNHLIDKYNEMNKQKYPLHHIQTAKAVSECKKILIDIYAQIKACDYSKIEDEIDTIYKNVNSINEQLEIEENAKALYEKNKDNIYNEADIIERNHAKRVKAQEDIDKDFSLSSERANINNRVKTEIQKLSIKKRALDTVIYSAQPYSICLDRLNDLEKQVSIVKDVLDDSEKHVNKIKMNGKEALDTVNKCSYKLRNLEIELRNSKFEKIINAYVDQFASGYKLIDTLKKLLNTKPIDLATVEETRNKLIELVKNIDSNATKDLEDAKYCERLILFANQYRNSVAGLANEISKAEVFYYDGKYPNAIELLLETLKQMQLPTDLDR